MFVNQISLHEALKMAIKGKEVKILIPSPDGGWEDMCPTTLGKMLGDCLFFRTEPELAGSGGDVDDQGEAAKNPPPSADGADPGSSAGTAKPTSKRVGAGAKRKPVDTGKLLALRKAGWSMKKIGEELRISEATVCNYLKKLEDAEN